MSDQITVNIKNGAKETMVYSIDRERMTPSKLFHSVALASLSARISVLEAVANKVNNDKAESISVAIIVRLNSKQVLKLPLDTNGMLKVEDAAKNIENELTEKLPTYIVRTNTFRAIY